MDHLKRNLKRSLFTALIVVVSVVYVGAETCGKEGQTSDEPLSTVECFLKDWLIRRDIDAAMMYVSIQPALGTCARTSVDMGKKGNSYSDCRKSIEWLFGNIAKTSPEGSSLDLIIESEEITPAFARNIARGKPFELFSLGAQYRKSRYIVAERKPQDL